MLYRKFTIPNDKMIKSMIKDKDKFVKQSKFINQNKFEKEKEINKVSKSEKGGCIAYLCLQQVRKPENLRFQGVLPVTVHLWTGRGLQVKLSRQWFL